MIEFIIAFIGFVAGMSFMGFLIALIPPKELGNEKKNLGN